VHVHDLYPSQVERKPLISNKRLSYIAIINDLGDKKLVYSQNLKTAWKLVSLPANVQYVVTLPSQYDIRILPMYVTIVTHQYLLRSVEFALKGSVALDVGIPRISHILLVLSKPSPFETPFSFDSDQSATHS
jgi:hypothetical protein